MKPAGAAPGDKRRNWQKQHGTLAVSVLPIREGGQNVPVSLSEAIQTLLSGESLSWEKFGEHKAGSIQISSAGGRRLLDYLFNCDRIEVEQGSEELFDGLIAAWQSESFDPAAVTKQETGEVEANSWRLQLLECSGFGGLNQLGGPDFVLRVNTENWCLEGQNGSGKTSIASAMIWALTGYRCRDQEGLVREQGRREPVFNDSGVQIGDWPPLIAYPSTPSKLSGTAEAWVRLTFRNESGEVARAFRSLSAPVSGEPVLDAKIDAPLLAAPQLIETGLLMPARLGRIGFGERSQTIYEAVKLLTGLDQLADIGEGAAKFSHRSKRFLKYGLDNGIQRIEARMESLLESAGKEAEKAAFRLTISKKPEDEEFAEELRDIAKRALEEAGSHLELLASELVSGLDTSKAEDRLTIKNAVSAARGILQQGVKGIAVFNAWAALKAAHSDPTFQKLPAVLADAKARLSEALVWDKRQAEDTKLRLKALASQFFAPSVHTHEVPDCPLCESKLSGEKREALAAELEELKMASSAAERKLVDACAEFEKSIREVLPVELETHFAALATMQPRDSFQAAATERFAEDPPFSTVLTGMGRFAKVTAEALASDLPAFEFEAPAQALDIPGVARNLLSYMHNAQRVSFLVSWWVDNRQQFVDAWSALKGVADTNGEFSPDSLEGKLQVLEAALERAEPLDDLGKKLNDAATEADKWLVIRTQQLIREDIADALEPLKDLRTLVATETASSISALSGRIKSVLDRIHFKERLSFEDAALSKKSVQISGSFDHGIRVDASMVANSSWLRAILWSFVFALREQTIERFGANPFPLTVLDDPQVTFDPRNKRKWAQEIAGLANAEPKEPEAMQLIVITHERQFFQFLVNNEKLTGQQGMVAPVNRATGTASVVNGSSLARSYQGAVDNNDDAAAQDYISEVRIYCEDLLKIMLRGADEDVSGFNLSKLVPLLDQVVSDAVPPFNLRPFAKLLNVFKDGNGGRILEILNSAHHIKDGSIGVAQAKDVKEFWEKALQTRIHTCFKIYAEYEAYSGEPRLFPWMDSVVPLPEGNSDELKAIKFLQTGIAAAAKSDGRVGDGLITIEEFNESEKVTLHNHDAYQLASGTLDPVAAIGDVIIVSNYAKVRERNLVVAACGDQLLARRYNLTDIHPHMAILTGQSVDPHDLPQPIIVPTDRLKPRKIVGTLFASSKLPVPPKDDNVEFLSLSDISIVRALLEDAKLFKVVGRSAEPIALDGQFIMTQPVSLTPPSLLEMEGHLVIAVDDAGARYFKRFRRHNDIVVLESLNPDGTAPAEILGIDGKSSVPTLAGLLRVVGVLFELPS